MKVMFKKQKFHSTKRLAFLLLALFVLLVVVSSKYYSDLETLGWKTYTSKIQIKFRAPPTLQIIGLESPYLVDIRDPSSIGDDVRGEIYMQIVDEGCYTFIGGPKAGKVIIGDKVVDRFGSSSTLHVKYDSELKLKQGRCLHFVQGFPREKEGKSLKLFDKILSTIEFF